MTPEEYQRIKEAEKAHLRSLQRLKAALGTLRQTQSVREALSDLARAEHTLDESTALIDRLAAETAQQEARLDLALDAVAAQPASDAGKEDALRLDRARTLLHQLKQEIAASERERSKTEGSEAKHSSTREEPVPAARKTRLASGELPPKTIGRMKK